MHQNIQDDIRLTRLEEEATRYNNEKLHKERKLWEAYFQALEENNKKQDERKV